MPELTARLLPTMLQNTTLMADALTVLGETPVPLMKSSFSARVAYAPLAEADAAGTVERIDVRRVRERLDSLGVTHRKDQSAYLGGVQRHLALLRAFFGLTPTPESAEWSLDRVATWRLRHGINRDRIGRADAALCAMLAAIGSEAESLLRQGRQGELLRKLYSPRALGRRLRNILTRLRKVFAS